MRQVRPRHAGLDRVQIEVEQLVIVGNRTVVGALEPLGGEVGVDETDVFLFPAAQAEIGGGLVVVGK
ncbi:hypothetical protein SGFS_011560 [Streptomyces graminofaciens]|uniref:Uncharacterized protein n=1 Tax=Streptomyces graminofaciens TaxID=68212 RepID=A0ABN5V997_9ACTN|nr:hypothetical protein SGFS_011560 [Streptomyces graminofaciens]